MQHLQSIYFVHFFILFFSSSALGVTLVSLCYCPNATEFQNPDPGYFPLRQTARKLCRTQQLNAATIYRVPVPPISGLPPYDVIKTMAPFAAYIPSDYRTMTLATLAAVSNQSATDTNIKNQYFGDLATNRTATMAALDLEYGNFSLAMAARGAQIKAAQEAINAPTTTVAPANTTTTLSAGRKKREADTTVSTTTTTTTVSNNSTTTVTTASTTTTATTASTATTTSITTTTSTATATSTATTTSSTTTTSTTTTMATTTTTKKVVTTTTTTTTTRTTTTTQYVYRATVTPPTVDTMVPTTTMCGVYPSSGGNLVPSSACLCDPPRIQYTKRLRFNYPWNRNLSDPSSPDFKSAKLIFEEQCDNLILNSTSVIGAGYSGCFVKSFTIDGSTVPATTSTTAANTTAAATTATTTVAGATTTTTTTTTTTLIPTVTNVTLTTLAVTNVTTLTTPALPGRRKRQTSAATVIADVVISFSAGISNTTLDQAIANATTGNGTSPNITSLDQASPSRPCYGFNLTAMNPVYPVAYFQTAFPLDGVVASGYYIYFTCTLTGTTNPKKFRLLNATDPATGTVTGQFGVLCSDGAFVQPTAWPLETACVITDTCNTFPVPSADSLYKPLGLALVPSGTDIYYQCTDPDAVLDDKSGRNFFPMRCQGTSVGVVTPTGFVPATTGYVFPKCLPRCSLFFIGDKFVAVNTSVEIRAGQSMQFNCPDNFYVANQAYSYRSVMSTCLPTGKFATTTMKCVQIPCTDDAITAITPISGIYKTTNVGPIPVGSSIYFTCADKTKVPNSGSSQVEAACQAGGNFTVIGGWPADPGCVYTCSNFANIPNMKKVSNLPVLANRSIEYICRNPRKIPNTGQRFFLQCLTNGKFQGEADNYPGTDWPTCVFGCVEFPQIDSYKATSQVPLLPNMTTEYVCSMANLMPYTGVNLTLTCMPDGVFNYTSPPPQCVRRNTCRQPFFPTYPGFTVNDSSRVFYSYGENIEMRCNDTNLVAEGAHIFSKETFSVLCAGPDRANPIFINPTSWPRCIPRGCVKTYENEVSSMGKCNCEFNECQEYVFNLLTDQCPNGNNGPTCGLLPYDDWSADIERNFDPPPPINRTDLADITAVINMFKDVATTIAKVETILNITSTATNATASNSTATAANTTTATTNATATNTTATGKRKKRFSVALSCREIPPILNTITILIQEGYTMGIYQVSTIQRNRQYIDASTVKSTDCSKDEVTILTKAYAALKANVTAASQELPKLQDEAAKVESQRVLWLDQWQNVSALQRQLDQAKFDQKIANEIIIQKEALARATAVPICICYSTIGPSTTTTIVAGGTTTTTITTKTTTANGTSAVTTTVTTTTVANTTTTTKAVNTTATTTTKAANATSSNTTAASNSSAANTTTASPNATTNATTTGSTTPSTTTTAGIVGELGKTGANCVCWDQTTTTTPTTTTTASNTTTTAAGNSSTTKSNATASNSTTTAATTNATTTTTKAANTTVAGRKKRSVSETEASSFLVRDKRALRFRCDTTMTYGLMFYDVRNPTGMLANRCCCPNYRGELFNFTCTIDEPWNNGLADPRNSIYKAWRKTVNQEVKYMLYNRMYSSLMVNDLLGNATFVNFQKTTGSLTGVNFVIWLTKPHWDNNKRIETAFRRVAELYYNQTSVGNVFGRVLLGDVVKHNYVFGNPQATHAERIPFPDYNSTNEDTGSGDLAAQEAANDEEIYSILYYIFVILGSLLLCFICLFLVGRTKACLCRNWV